MQFINEIFKDIQPLYPLEHFARPDRILFIDDGIVYEEGTPKEFFDHPQKPRTKEFLSQVL